MDETPPEIDVEILYHPGCGHVSPTVDAVRQALEDLNLGDRARVREYAIETEEQADEVGLRGSPTIRINGSDVEEWENRPRLHCREFQGPGGERIPHPPVSAIRAALEDAPRARYDFQRDEPGIPDRRES